MYCGKLAKKANEGVGEGKDHTIFATVEGNVKFRKGFKGRTFISVIPMADAAE